MSDSRGEGSFVNTVAQILKFIHKRGYTPGERLPSERDLAERFSVGRGQIREALSVLETVRYLERRPNSGVFLHKRPSDMSMEALVLFSDLSIPLDISDIQDSLELQRLLDVQAMRLACLRRTSEDVDGLKLILKECQRFIDEGRSIADLDMEFHLAIVHAAHNSVFLRLIRPFYLITHRMRQQLFENVSYTVRSNAHHLKMLDAIARGEANTGMALMAEHLDHVQRHYAEQRKLEGELQTTPHERVLQAEP
jgi:GntR family transcriptional repressor for pyruvate dehydrogenase complex